DLAPKKEAKLSPSQVKFLDLAKKHITTKAGAFNLSKEGKLALTQFLTIKDASKFIAGVNGVVSEGLEQMAEKMLQAKDKDPFWDEESLKHVQATAKKGHAWLRLDDGRLSLHLPVTPAVVTKLKRDVLGVNQLADLSRLLDVENLKDKD